MKREFVDEADFELEMSHPAYRLPDIEPHQLSLIPDEVRVDAAIASIRKIHAKESPYLGRNSAEVQDRWLKKRRAE